MSDKSYESIEIESSQLDIERLNRAWRLLIDRHDMLRAMVRPDGRQQILKDVPRYEIEVLDLTGKDEEVVERELQAVRERTRGRERGCTGQETLGGTWEQEERSSFWGEKTSR
jgi:hypothetical protein